MTSTTPNASIDNAPFLRACRQEKTPYTPIWLMRQAGRYQPEYRAIRAKVSFLELCKTPDLAAEVTVLAAQQLGVDAAIIFADILLVLEPMGSPISFGVENDGPKILKPVRTAKDIDDLRGEIEDGALGYVYEAIRRVRKAIPGTPLIGFAGAPFTLASYAIEGGGSKNYVETKTLMYSDEGAFHSLMEKLSEATVRHLNAQIAAGCQAVQLFDSWAGALSPSDYRRYVLPHMKRIISRITKGVPIITFGTGTGGFLDLMAESGANVVGVDWREDMAKVAPTMRSVALQGNLDPVVLMAPLAEMKKRVIEILDAMREHPGHIFNLGHGILPSTPVAHAKALVEMVHELSSNR